MLRRRDVTWQEIISATGNVLSAISETKTRQVRPMVKRVYRSERRVSKKAAIPQWSIIAEAEAADFTALISGRR